VNVRCPEEVNQPSGTGISFIFETSFRTIGNILRVNCAKICLIFLEYSIEEDKPLVQNTRNYCKIRLDINPNFDYRPVFRGMRLLSCLYIFNMQLVLEMVGFKNVRLVPTNYCSVNCPARIELCSYWKELRWRKCSSSAVMPHTPWQQQNLQLPKTMQEATREVKEKLSNGLWRITKR
jgi:hypothetical protein